jgi:ankyrin repeat protein
VHKNRFNDIEVLKYLEENGLELDLNAIIEHQYGATFFILISAFSERAFVKYLKKKYSADIHAKDDAGRDALSFAVTQGCIGAVEYLVEELGANVDTIDKGGTSALSRASVAKFPKFEIVQCLVRNHAQLEIANKEGVTAVMNAVISNHFKIMEYLKKSGAHMDATDNEGNTLLIFAAKNGYTGIIRFLIENSKVNVNVKNIHGRTALMESINSSNTNPWSGFGPIYLCFEETIEYLINIGAHIDKNLFLLKDEDSLKEKKPLKGTEAAKTVIVKKSKGLLQNEIIQTLFLATHSPFLEIGGNRGTFGRYVVDSIMEYANFNTDRFTKFSNSEWDILLDWMNDRPCCKRWAR